MNDPVAGADGHACAPADPSAKIAEPFAPGPELIKDPTLPSKWRKGVDRSSSQPSSNEMQPLRLFDRAGSKPSDRHVWSQIRNAWNNCRVEALRPPGRSPQPSDRSDLSVGRLHSCIPNVICGIHFARHKVYAKRKRKGKRQWQAQR